ncbi:UvrD-helicase domain-containing protein [Heyndrickxia acidicola]|uniref:DNA 3'-5' helicase n=1 Tax=Heyndrickxia acidicola TaxID=209389 RepID=A0ABU6MDT8_9BACI|nr:UvrD-helicase domain-containing protein [Heyndrickxia acidicola]MED1202816.1 UvrD-helicase domain-containing protein [Heyndrickxia acidicola]
MIKNEEKHYFRLPAQAQTLELPFAEIAETVTSVELVRDGEDDAFYFRSLEEQGILLNRGQIDAVRTIQGPVLIIAGAGSGKTTVLVSRTGYLLQVAGIPPQKILLMTFTKKAAEEMKERIAAIPGIKLREARSVETRTFHSFFLQILRHQGYSQEMITNEKHKQIVLKKKMKELGMDDAYQPETILSLLSFIKMEGKGVEDLPSKTNADKELKQLCSYYESWKKENHKMDFDDVLTEAYRLLTEDEGLLKVLQQRFQYIMVDEYQDTNILQSKLIKLLALPENHLCVVGDDDQTIYAFQGASQEIILQFDQEYKQAKTVFLTVNYRSVSPIVGLGNAVIQHNGKRKPKVLQSTKKSSITPFYSRPWSTDDEAKWIVETIQQKVKEGLYQYRDFAILHRTANNSRAIFEQLAMEEVPFLDTGTGESFFYEQSIIRTVIAYLRLSKDSLDLFSLEAILPTLYISRDRGIEWVERKQKHQIKEQPFDHLLSYPGLKPFQIKSIESRGKLIKELSHLKPMEAVRKIRGFFDQYLEMNERHTATTQKEFSKEQLDELETSASRFDTIDDFFYFIGVMKKRHEQMKMIKQDPGANVITLMTIHKAKGLEFPVVFFIGASEGILPHVTAIEMGKYEDQKVKIAADERLKLLEEERRLAYVAITRAKEELYISSPAFYRGKKTDVSRFIHEAFQRVKEKPKDNGRTVRKGKSTPAEVKGKVPAWICTSEDCIAWQRISGDKSSLETEKKCPICGDLMKKGEKLI